MIPENESLIIEAMQFWGGSFAKAIAEAYIKADPSNKNKLYDAFTDLFDSYKKFIIKD